MVSNVKPPIKFERLNAIISDYFEFIPLPLAISTVEDAIYVYVNKAFLSILGYSESEVLGKSVLELNIWGSWEERNEAVALLKKHGELTGYPSIIPTKSGDILDVIFHTRFLRIDGEVYIISTCVDITELKRSRLQAEESVRASQRELRCILDNVPDIISRFDRNLRYTFTNAAITAITKHPRKYYLGRANSELEFQKDFFPKWDQYLREVFETGEDRLFEFEDCSSGKVKYFQVKFTPEFDENRQVISVLSVNRDITDRVLTLKQKEELIKAENKMFTGGPVVVYKRRGGLGGPLEYVSPNVAGQLGFETEDFLSGKIQYIEQIHPEDKEHWQASRERIVAGIPFSEAEYRVRRADGEYRWIYDHTISLKDEAGTMTGYQGYLLDITDRKSSEKAIEESERKYRELVEAANVIIMHLDEKGHILFINDFGLKFFGYEPAELINHSFKDTILPHQESSGRDLWSVFDEIFTNKHERIVLENIRMDGRRVWIEWTNRFSKDLATGQLRLITIGTDITARRRAEATLKINYGRTKRNKLLNDVLEERISEKEFIRLAEKEGIHLVAPFACSMIIFDFTRTRLNFLLEDREEWQAWMDTAVDLISAWLGGVAWIAEDGIAVLRHIPNGSAPKNSSAITDWAGQLTDSMKDVFRGVNYVVGVSTVQREIKTIYRQAREAALAGPIFNPDKGVFHWRDLGMSQFILEQAKSTTGREFVKEWLGSLHEKQTAKNDEWLNTLREIISGDNMSAVASRLHIHTKTLAFRKRKIEQMLQTKLDDPETRLNIAVALKLKQLQEKLPKI